MNKKGFTLIELLVVIAIIGLLSTLAVIALGSAREKSRDAKRVADLKQVQTALELYYTENGEYPTAAQAVTLGSGQYACLDASGFAASCAADAYLGQVPADPGSSAYSYTSADGTTYSITVTLESTVNNMNGEITVSPSGFSDTSTST